MSKKTPATATIERGDVAEGAHADKRHDDGGDKLDRGDGRQRHAVDRKVKHRVHESQRDPERDDQRARAPRSPSIRTRHGRRQSAKTAAAEAILSQATPSTPT